MSWGGLEACPAGETDGNRQQPVIASSYQSIQIHVDKGSKQSGYPFVIKHRNGTPHLDVKTSRRDCRRVKPRNLRPQATSQPLSKTLNAPRRNVSQTLVQCCARLKQVEVCWSPKVDKGLKSGINHDKSGFYGVLLDPLTGFNWTLHWLTWPVAAIWFFGRSTRHARRFSAQKFRNKFHASSLPFSISSILKGLNSI